MNILKKFFSHRLLFAILLVFAMLLCALLSLCIGATYVPIKDVFLALIGKNSNSANSRIVLFIRLPRALSALSAGMGLAVSGAVLQAVLKNPLASCGVMGINSGSGLMVLVAALVFPASVFVMPLFAFIGAVISALSVYFLASKSGTSKSTMVLSGVAISAFLGAIIDTLITLFPEIGLDRLAFTIGGFVGANITTSLISLSIVAIGVLFSILLSYDLNMLALGDDIAASLGQKTKVVKLLSIIVVAILSGASIAVGGLIGFVGLIVPHIARLIFGFDNRIVLPISAVLGGLLTLFCDILARTIFSPYEIPVGIILSIIGAPFFIFLLFKSKRHAR